MRKVLLLAMTAIFTLSMSAQCPQRKGCCPKEKTECCQKNKSDKKCNQCKKAKKCKKSSKEAKCDKCCKNAKQSCSKKA